MTKLSMSTLALGIISLSTSLFATSPFEKVNCPADYQPTLCTYDNLSAEGGNRCWAMVSLQTQLQANGIDYDAQQIRCVKNDVQRLKIVKPDCGIVPTTTTCSAIVKGETWTETATSCDDPLPTLQGRLTMAGIDLSQVAINCVKEQFN